MDFHTPDIHLLAQQLRKPTGQDGMQTGTVMAEFNMPAITFTFECMNVQPADRILEIGFGPGEGIAEAARLTPDGFVAGIDHSETMLVMAEERNHRAVMKEHVELTLGDASALPYPDDAFDKVFAINVFHFWSEPSAELAECRRVLTSGGTVFFYLTHPSSWLKGIDTTGVFIAREAADVETLLRSAGFSDVASRDYTYNNERGFVVWGAKA